MKITFWLSIACLCLSITSLARADHMANVQRILQSSYDKSDAAFSRGGVEGFLTIYANNYVAFEDGGTVSIHNKKELRQWVRHQMQANKKLGKSDTIKNMTIYKNEAVVIVQSYYSKNGNHEGTEGRDLWRKLKDRWWLEQSNDMD